MNIDIKLQLKAFKDALAYAEGTDKPGFQATRNHGYDVIVGGQLFTDYRDHPRKSVYLPRYKIYSTAAGRYQFIRATWDSLRRRLGLKNFSPESQDAACDELLRECGARARLAVGDFDGACTAGNKIWASLPGSPHGQRTESADKLRAIFKKAGGIIK